MKLNTIGGAHSNFLVAIGSQKLSFAGKELAESFFRIAIEIAFRIE